MAAKVTVHQWGGATLNLWQMQAGDKLPRHSHSWVHTTAVARGSTMVDVFGEIHEMFEMRPGDPDYAFTANVEHEITALEDDTIIVNLHTLVMGEKGKDGGITFDDS
jgi:quercetin dioxygenase-like cupin family protein